MVYIPRITFKTGIGASVIRTFPMDGNYNGTQRLMLTSSRIFGTHYGGNFRSGMALWRNTTKTFQNLQRVYNVDIAQLKRYMPWFQDQMQDSYRRGLAAHRQQKKIKKQNKKKKKKGG